MKTTNIQDTINLWTKLSLTKAKFLLYWEIGSWKTHFVKGIAIGLWINPNLVQSPTYTYMNIYENKLLHIDLDRMNNFEDFVEKWILDYINDFEYVAIEWPKFEENYVDQSWCKINFKKISPEIREITID